MTFDEFKENIAEMVEKSHEENRSSLVIDTEDAMSIYAGIENLQVGLKVERQRAEQYMSLLLGAITIGLLDNRDNNDLWNLLRKIHGRN